MATKITLEVIDYVEALAKLELTEEEKQKAQVDMEQMLGFIDVLGGLDTENIEPMSHIFPNTNCFREDVVTNEADVENILKNAPDIKNDMFKVPKTFG